jgi:hypothetical protein
MSQTNCSTFVGEAIQFNRVLNVVRIWILFSTLLVASGWILSALHQLNRLGYGIIFALAVVAAIFFQRKNGWKPEKNFRQLLHQSKKCFRRFAPFLFLVLALMALVAGALYVPQNNDSNEYRIPRVWHWLAAEHWHWIHTADIRMNIAGCGFEWLATPLMLFTKYDRCIFLVNWVSYLMLPGLIFSVFTRLQVRPRVAWWWMWILPSGWCYVMQAASEVNDSFAVIYALASVDFALRARQKNNSTDLFFSILAAALLTGAKQTEIPLILIWIVAVVPAWRLMRLRPVFSGIVCLIALIVSALPLMYFDIKNMGTWAGIPVSGYWSHCEPSSPFWGIVGNTFCLTAQNLHPPYFPFANRWNETMHHFLQTPLGSHFASFESFGLWGDGASVGNAGIGLWIFLLTIISLCAAFFFRNHEVVKKNIWLRCLRWMPFVSLLIFMAKVGTYQNARQLAPYYVFLFPALLVSSAHAKLVRKSWWQWSALATLLLTAGMLVIARSQPLFPAKTILLPLKEKHPHWRFLSRAWESYACRLSVEEQRTIFDDSIPPDETVIGYATLRGSQEPGKWVPFGHRKVERVLPDDTPQELQAKRIHFVLVDPGALSAFNMTIADWTNRLNGTLIDTAQYETTPGATATDYLIRIHLPPKN